MAGKDFRGTGWALPVDTGSDGRVETASDRSDVEQAIRIILSTAKGERVMRPGFGCGIHEYTFAAIDTTTLRLIETSVREALETWERRIDVVAVETDTTHLDEGQLDIEITYRLRRTNDEYNLVYPFYVEGA
jgi:phage baseplate assembly protein W